MVNYIHLFFLHCRLSPKIVSRSISRNKKHRVIVVPYVNHIADDPEKVVEKGIFCLEEKFGSLEQVKKSYQLVVHLEANYGSPGDSSCNQKMILNILQHLKPDHLIFHSSTHEALYNAYDFYPNSFITIRGDFGVATFKETYRDSSIISKILPYNELTTPFVKTRRLNVSSNNYLSSIGLEQREKNEREKQKKYLLEVKVSPKIPKLVAPTSSTKRNMLFTFDRLIELDSTISEVRNKPKQSVSVQSSSIFSVRAQMAEPFSI